jgi:transcriptional regulator with XRE-family HTH domain
MTDWVAFSVDLEPNKDGSFTGVAEAMAWFDDVVPRGTVYATHRIASERPEIVQDLSERHEIGVHVHPREFGHERDQLAELRRDRQRELIARTREYLASVTGVDEAKITSFRAGRHSASEATLDVLSDLGFDVDASVNVNYTDYLPDSMTERRRPFALDSGLVELPTTYGRPPLLSRPGIRALPSRTLTATAHTLRTDSRGCTGLRAVQCLLDRTDGMSAYMHPYDATGYHADLPNAGVAFRDRFERVVARHDGRFLTATDIV